MSPSLLHLYGPFSIQCYGLCIWLGLLITLKVAYYKNNTFNLIPESVAKSLIPQAIVAGLLGARILYVITSWSSFQYWSDIITVWQGGFSIIGSVLGILITITWYSTQKELSVAKNLDFLACNAPLLQSISRIGCFFSGCCFGNVTTNFFSITYTDPDSFAPLNCQLHPTQLYSSIALFFIFLFLHSIQKKDNKPGIITAWYLILIAVERFWIDFLRGDREFFEKFPFDCLSIHQWFSLIILIATIGYLLKGVKKYELV